MAQPKLRQISGNATHSGVTQLKATFTNPTINLNLVVVIVTLSHSSLVTPTLTMPAGYTFIRSARADELTVYAYYRESAPPTSSVTMGMGNARASSLIILEYEGAAQTNALDKFTFLARETNDRPQTGTTAAAAQADSIIVAGIANRYHSTSQSGFSGGLTRLLESSGSIYDPDERRVRLTIHQKISTLAAIYSLAAYLSSARDWVAFLLVFRGGSSGPARFSASQNTQTTVKTEGQGVLTVFGPLRGVLAGQALAISSGQGRIAPFNYQYRLNGWSGLLIGSGTPFNVEGTEGLNGWQMRTSDDDLPRGDGALRGIDLESARQVLFRMNVGRTRLEVEQNMETLFRSLVPQRDEDWEMIWRHPGQPLKMMRCRPIDLLRDRNNQQLFFAKQTFVLRAADPRHYGAIPKVIDIPVSTSSETPIYTPVINIGNAAAYPLITVKGPTSGPAVNRIELVNSNGLYTFDARLTLATGGLLLGDMEARVTGAPRSIVTLDGQSKYGSWQLPREPFRLEPGPAVEDGENIIYLRTDPPGAPVQCTLTYRDTWAG